MAETYAQLSRVGFATSVSLPPIGHAVSNGLCLGDTNGSNSERYLIYSNLGIDQPKATIKKTRKKKRARTSNRKRVSLSETITHDGVVYSIINGSSYGVYLGLLHKIIEQLNICFVKWKRVFVIRFDLHQEFYTEKNGYITKFRNNLNRRLDRAYGIFEVGYVWVREHEKAKQQHYHFALFLDGDKVNHSAIISGVIADTWERVKVGNTVHIPKHCFYNVVDSETKADAVKRLSYLAKQRGKGYRPNQTKDYSTSRLVARQERNDTDNSPPRGFNA